jgi:S1-C subfamily serine protease
MDAYCKLRIRLRTKRLFTAGLAYLTIGGVTPAWWPATLLSISRADAATAAAPRAVTPRGPFGEDEKANIALFKSASPSVVHITTLEYARDFFSLDVQQIPRGTGSGFVWDEQGRIVTNYHVIQGANAATITLHDQSTWKASLVGAFPDRDLAVLQIEAPREKLKPVPIGTSRDLIVGQRVYAIGNPFGLDQTLTIGIISALNREIESVTQRKIRGVIQTDAAINPGNSGGPLLDSAGRLIGVNTSIYSPSGASAGIGFAIPVDEINRIVPRLIRDGKFERPVLGVQFAPAQLLPALGLDSGVAVLDVVRGGPAGIAGLKPFYRNPSGKIVFGDVIVAIDDRPVNNVDELFEVLEARQPGDTVSLTVLRGKKQVRQRLTVKLASPD